MLPLRAAVYALAGTAVIAAAAGTAGPPAHSASTPPAPPSVPAHPTSDIPHPTSPGPVLRGIITDESGKPLKGVKVQLYSGLATRWEGQSAITGDDGAYVFDPLETGAMTKPENREGWDYSVGVRIEHGTHVPKEGMSWFDITVPMVDRHVSTRDLVMVPGGVLDGEIRLEDGFGWSALDLRFMPTSGKGSHWYATTDRKGRFATRAMLPGEYSVQWNSPHAEYPELARVRLEPGQRTTVKVSAKITVVARATSVHGPLARPAE